MDASLLKIVCIVGLSGVGKTEAVAHISRLSNFELVYFGGVVLAEVKARGLNADATSEAVVREDLRREFGMDVMAGKSLEKIVGALRAHRHVLIDGLYSYSEYRLLRDRFGEAVQLIAVHSRKSLRAERLASRAVRPLTSAEMMTRDKKEIETLEKAPPIALADYHVVNDYSLNCFRVQLTSCLRAIMERSLENA